MLAVWIDWRADSCLPRRVCCWETGDFVLDVDEGKEGTPGDCCLPRLAENVGEGHTKTPYSSTLTEEPNNVVFKKNYCKKDCFFRVSIF